MNVSLSKFNQSLRVLDGDGPKRTTWPQIKGEPSAGLPRHMAPGFEMQSRRRMCLHDGIVFIHQKQSVQRGGVVELLGDGG